MKKYTEHKFDKRRNMNDNMEVKFLMDQMATLQANMQTLMLQHTNEVSELKKELEQVKGTSLVNQPQPVPLEEISTRITRIEEVRLDTFKSLPVFDGDIKKYRVWREDTSRMMDSIEPLKNTSIYAQALQIVKTKIQGAAAQVLANHGTIFNFEAIRNRLDYTYADTRPLYVLQEEMKRCYQGRKTLGDFHDEVNQCLSLIISKISMSGYGREATNAMTEQAKQDSVRIFVAGVNNTFVQSTLYANAPQDLEHAYTIARTIEHDGKHQNLNLSYETKQSQKIQSQPTQRYQPRQHFNNYQPRQHFNSYQPQQHFNKPRQHFNNYQPQEFAPRQHFNSNQPRPEPMDVSSGNTIHRQTTQYNNQLWKRQGNFPRDKMRNNNIITGKEDDDTRSIDVETGTVNKLVTKNLKLINGLPHITMTDGEKTYDVLIDTGATHNYVKKSLKFNSVRKIKPMKVISMHGASMIGTKQTIKFLGRDMDFFELDNIGNTDLILKWKGIDELGAIINRKDMTFTVNRKEEVMNINYIVGNDAYREKIDKLMRENNGIGPLPFTTTIEATIRTKTDEPIWTKQYPYPIADNDFVNEEIKRLLDDGIIQRSNSPYNSPIWTVPKKGLDKNGRPKKRMVIDFQKLNSHTITDRYIIPDVNMTIQNLGRAKYFTTLDLESGFHQIRIKKEDREKTAFCVNGGKYEFKRMPFGLKNAPSIFQRCVDDILREYIGKFAYVYIDDVLIYSSSPEEHMEHIETIFNALNKATLKVSNEKSKFFQTEVEYLGHIIKHNKIATNPEKVEVIEKYPLPQTLKDLRGFLGMTGYYRKFVQGYASITKPLTVHLRGDNGQVGKNKSAKTKIELDDAAIQAFNKLKSCLKEQVELFQPNYDKPFELTTDASNIAIGAVLSQMKKPIFFLSRTLSKTEENYSTNEKELLAIIWALQKLRNYIYGTTDLTIYTDHQSLTHAISEKNPNPKLKRWKAVIEDFGAKLVYKPGHQNVVADALSRQCINTSSIDTVHSAESSYTEIIKQVNQPFNAYAIQIELVPNKRINETRTRTIFSNKVRHTINFTNEQNLITELKKILQPNKTTALHTTRENIYALSPIIKNTFSTANFVYTPTKLIDVREEGKQIEIVEEIHNRAHRGYRNNIQEILEKYYWPKIKQQCKSFNKKCTPCLYGKYERNPTREPLGDSDIPTEPGRYIHMDIYFNDNKTFLVAIDKFSKYITLREIDSREHMSEKIEEVLTNNYPHCTRLMTDNEKCLNTPAVNMMCIKYGIKKIETPVYRSTSNGQVERAHSTISELARIFKIQNATTIAEEIYKTIRELNNTIHTVTGQKPVDIFFNRIKYDKKDIYEKLKKASEKTLERLNQGTKHRTFSPNEQILVKIKGVRRKKDARYIKYIVKEDREDTVLTTRGKIVHKDNIKNYTINHDHLPDITRDGHDRNQGRNRN